MFKKILVANRGEIACRIMRTARSMNIATVAVVSSADRDSAAARMADDIVEIGPPPAAQSYLRIDKIVAAAKSTGADAVHPGYGFLAENPRFAEAMTDAGVCFIGPPAGAIAAMGDKITAKRLAEKAGVTTVPGHDGEIAGEEEAVRVAAAIGYPVMLKATAGGGGKGMRITNNEAEAREGFAATRREALSSFGDDRLFMEKYIQQPRHIEIQLIADNHGNVVHLGERECSLQRRHQKVIEEAPSPFLDQATRAAMGAQACALAKAVDYRSAGTVEFILDQDHNFYFLEMNTRLQVEHPVTELVTGLDLVELMIRIAAGEALPFSQDQVTTNGWAIETRLYAEDPSRGFLPSIGRLTRFRPPHEQAGEVRVDTGVHEGAEVSIYYDPMIAKLVTHGRDRAAAIERMSNALDRFDVRGVTSNAVFLAALINHPRFQEGRLSVDFIADEFPDGFAPDQATGQLLPRLVAVAALLHTIATNRACQIGSTELSPIDDATNWVVNVGEAEHSVRVARAETGYTITQDRGTVSLATHWQPGEPLMQVDIDGHGAFIRITGGHGRYRLAHAGAELDFQVLPPNIADLMHRMPVRPEPDHGRFLLSPMPGLLVSIAVASGALVKAGDTLAVVEAMKMENVLRAHRDGTVKAIHATAGDSLTVD
ncbi:MAG: acetyl-CoA carboxylase biotin carboxylase subunit, partial [Alphaproteobacteria bacterium]